MQDHLRAARAPKGPRRLSGSFEGRSRILGCHWRPWRSVCKLHLVPTNELTFVLTSGDHNAGIGSEPGHRPRTYQVRTRQPDERYFDPESWQAKTPVRQWTLVARMRVMAGPGFNSTSSAPADRNTREGIWSALGRSRFLCETAVGAKRLMGVNWTPHLP
jgi:hypothetical protein